MFGLSFTADDLKRVAWTFVQAFLGALITGLAAWASIPQSWDAARVAVMSLVIAGLAAGISAVKNLVLADSSPVK